MWQGPISHQWGRKVTSIGSSLITSPSAASCQFGMLKCSYSAVMVSSTANHILQLWLLHSHILLPWLLHSHILQWQYSCYGNMAAPHPHIACMALHSHIFFLWLPHSHILQSWMLHSHIYNCSTRTYSSYGSMAATLPHIAVMAFKKDKDLKPYCSIP